MKLVKLNRTHTAFKENGHKWAFRWDSYDTKTVPKVEHILHEMHGTQYRWNSSGHVAWKSNFGHPVKSNHGYRPYWVSFTDEHDATVVLLKME